VAQAFKMNFIVPIDLYIFARPKPFLSFFNSFLLSFHSQKQDSSYPTNPRTQIFRIAFQIHQKMADYEYSWTWTCHLCHPNGRPQYPSPASGMLTNITNHCVECNHLRCDSCELTQHKRSKYLPSLLILNLTSSQKYQEDRDRLVGWFWRWWRSCCCLRYFYNIVLMILGSGGGILW